MLELLDVNVALLMFAADVKYTVVVCPTFIANDVIVVPE